MSSFLGRQFYRSTLYIVHKDCFESRMISVLKQFLTIHFILLMIQTQVKIFQLKRTFIANSCFCGAYRHLIYYLTPLRWRKMEVDI